MRDFGRPSLGTLPNRCVCGSSFSRYFRIAILHRCFTVNFKFSSKRISGMATFPESLCFSKAPQSIVSPVGEHDYIAFDEYYNEPIGRSFGNCDIYNTTITWLRKHDHMARYFPIFLVFGAKFQYFDNGE